MQSLGMEDWVSIQRRRKWRWAHQVATDTRNKWTLKAAMWDPTLDATCNPRRRPGRPVTRWTDDIIAHLARNITQYNNKNQQTGDNKNDAFLMEHSQWIDIAQDSKVWKSMEDSYVNRGCGHGDENDDDDEDGNDDDDDDDDDRCTHNKADDGHRAGIPCGHRWFTDTASADSCEQ